MFNKFDPYTVLGVERDATEVEIKAAYRDMAKNTHPDKNGGDDSQFKEVNRAYKLLMNADERAYYNSTGDADRRVPQLDVMAFQCVINYFSRVASDLNDRVDPLKEDLITYGKLFFNQENSNLEKQIGKYQRAIEMLQKIEKKVKAKSQSSVLNRGLQHHTATLVSQVQNITNQIAANKRAIEILDDHIFEKDASMYIKMYGFSDSNTSTFW